jgi:hypothetical protein
MRRQRRLRGGELSELIPFIEPGPPQSEFVNHGADIPSAKECERADFRQKRDPFPGAGFLDSIRWTRSRFRPHHSGSFSVARYWPNRLD